MFIWLTFRVIKNLYWTIGMMEKKITETIGYLLVQISRAHRNKAQELLARIELYPGQEFLLLSLWPKDGLTHSEVAEILGVQPATITRMLQRMDKTGLVESRPDSEDQRVSRVYLTDQGRELIQPTEQIWGELESITFANLRLEEKILLQRLLLQVYQNLGGGQ